MRRLSNKRNNRARSAALAATGLLLAVLALRAIEQAAPAAGPNPARAAGAAVAAPLVSGGSAIRHRLDRLAAAVRGNEALSEENERLRAEIAALRLQMADADARANRASAAVVARERFGPLGAAMRPVGVLSVVADRTRQQVWVAEGLRHGLRPGLVAMSADGIVGLVDEVFESTARVRLVTDAKSGWGVEVAGRGDLGVLRGTGEPDMMEMQFERTAVSAQVGDLVVSSGRAGSAAPAGIPFGVVEELTTNKKGEPLARVRLAGEPAALRSVYILAQGRLTTGEPAR
jgi:rod shape-determining protein MreC